MSENPRPLYHDRPRRLTEADVPDPEQPPAEVLARRAEVRLSLNPLDSIDLEHGTWLVLGALLGGFATYAVLAIICTAAERGLL